MTTSLIQLITLALAAIALVLGAWLLIVGKRPWRAVFQMRHQLSLLLLRCC